MWKFDRVCDSSPGLTVSQSRGALNLSLISSFEFTVVPRPPRVIAIHVSAVQSHSWKQVFRITFFVYTSKYTCQRKMCHKNSFMLTKLLITVTCIFAGCEHVHFINENRDNHFTCRARDVTQNVINRLTAA